MQYIENASKRTIHRVYPEHAQEPVGGSTGCNRHNNVFTGCDSFNWLVRNLNWATRIHFPLYLRPTAHTRTSLGAAI